MMIDVLRRRTGAAVLALGLLGAALGAQDPTPATAPKDPTPPADASSGASAGEATPTGEAAPTDLGRIATADTPIHCFPGPQSPLFEDLLAEGDVVRLVGGERDGFVEIALPLGMVGYVHSDFAAKRADGTVESTSAAVSFRYEPRGGRAPVSTVPRGTRFALLEEVEGGQWFKVRSAAQTGWIAKDRVVQIADAEALRSAQATWAETTARQRAAVEAAAERERARLATIAAREALAAKIEAFNAQVAEAGTAKRSLEAWVALDTQAQALESEVRAAFPTDTALVRAAAQAAQGAHAQRLLAEADRLVTEKPDMVTPPDPGPRPVADPLADASTGWLRYREPMFGTPRVELEKGGQVLFVLECTSGRYDLSIFDGFEVAVRGDKERPDPESRRILDVARLDVIGRPRR